MHLIKSTSQSREEVMGLRRITKQKLRELCKKDKLYLTPELNDVLYLHYQGFQYIENLDEYTDLKCLWLESNAISEIQGLDNQKKLKCLFLHNNLIRRIENLEFCTELDTINLSSNHIRKIENCGSNILPQLTSLNLSSNYLTDFDALRELENCKTLSVLDISNNRIDDILVVKIFAKMPALRVLVLNGNPVVSKLAQYRKTLILECKELTYLDSRPVFPRDRACAEAWKRGGYEEERNENQRWNRKDRDRMRENVNATIRMRNKYLSSDKQLELFTASDSENENVVSHEEGGEQGGNVRDGPILNINDDIWDEVRDDKQNNVSSSSSEESSEHTSSSLSVLDSSDPNSYESKDLNTNKLIQIIDDNTCKDEMIEENNVESIQEASDLPDIVGETDNELFDTRTDDHMPGVLPRSGESAESIESDVDTTMFDLVDIMLEKSGKSAAEYAKEAQNEPNNVKNVIATNEEDIQEKIANEQLSESLGQLTTNISLAMQELHKAHQQLTDSVDKSASSDSDESEKSLDWPEDQLLGINGIEFEEKANDKQMSSIACQFEEVKDESSTQIQTIDKANDDDGYDNDQNDNPAIKAFKKKEKDLKALLQRLEDENERIYGDIDLNTWNTKKDIVITQDNEKDEDSSVKNICENILNYILENLEIDKNAVKNYKIVDLDEYEQDEKSIQSTEENNDENFKTLNNVLSNFNKMMEEMIGKNREEKRRQEEKLKQIQRKSVGTTATEKSECLKSLLKSPNLAEFNADTNESLTKQLETVRVKQEKDLKKLVDRVYAQRHKYNDTLEVVDNRLVVVKQHTGEIEEIPRPTISHQANLDSDSDSDSVATENDFIWEGVPLIEACRLNITNKQENSSAFSSTFDYKPTNRLDITKVMQNLNKDSADSDSESSQTFYSLPDNTNTIDNIDKDFMNNLDFDDVKLNEKACGDQPIVQCTRSYEELRTLIGVEKDKTTLLTKEENNLLDHMLEQEKSCNFTEPLETCQENVLLQKLIDRTKNKEKDQNIPAVSDLQHDILADSSDLLQETTTNSAKEASEKKYNEIENDENDFSMHTDKIEYSTVQKIEFKHVTSSTEIELTEKHVKFETYAMSLNEETPKDGATEKIKDKESGKSSVNESVIREILEFLKKEDDDDSNSDDEQEIKKEVKSEEIEDIFKKTDEHEDSPDRQNLNTKQEESTNCEDEEHLLHNIRKENVKTADEHILHETNENEVCSDDNDVNVLLQYSEEAEKVNAREKTEEVYLKAEEKEKEENNIDAKNCGDNAQVTKKCIKDDGNAYLVLQSAKLFEYIGDGIHNENNILKAGTSLEDCSGSFISAIDEGNDDDDEKEETTTMTDISVQCDAEIKSD